MYDKEKEIESLEYKIIAIYNAKGPLYERAMRCLRALKMGDVERAREFVANLEREQKHSDKKDKANDKE